MKKLIAKTSDELLVEDVRGLAADEVVDAIATSIPGIDIAYKLAKAYMGRGMKLRQQRVLEWVEFVRDNLGEFSKQLFDNEQFQDCFVLLIEGYVKERAERKRKLHQQILLGIAKLTPEELEKYQLERMLMVTNQISLEALNVLIFIRSKLLKKIEEGVQEQLKDYKDKEGVEGVRLEDITRKRIIVSDYISKWIHERYNSNSEIVKKKYNLTSGSSKELRNEIVYKEHLKEIELMGPLPELANLDLLIRKNGVATWGGSVGSGYSISEFGYEYINYLGNANNV
ncbi:MAG: hypothetical protein NUV65_03630 [Candidatus Roizmanbacteria bacterium]|nr:hypothetical protein [Candidatus Roizmanbacteria bacterium]